MTPASVSGRATAPGAAKLSDPDTIPATPSQDPGTDLDQVLQLNLNQMQRTRL